MKSGSGNNNSITITTLAATDLVVEEHEVYIRPFSVSKIAFYYEWWFSTDYRGLHQESRGIAQHVGCFQPRKCQHKRNLNFTTDKVQLTQRVQRMNECAKYTSHSS